MGNFFLAIFLRDLVTAHSHEDSIKSSFSSQHYDLLSVMSLAQTKVLNDSVIYSMRTIVPRSFKQSPTVKILNHSPTQCEVIVSDGSTLFDEGSRALTFDIICSGDWVCEMLKRRMFKKLEGSPYPPVRGMLKKKLSPREQTNNMLLGYFEYELDGRRFSKESLFQKIVDTVVAMQSHRLLSWAC